MTPRPRIAIGILLIALAGCAAQQRTEPVHVTVADIESLPGEGLEVRMLVRLRVQNPNDVPLDYTGVFVQLDVLNSEFASGVSNEHGTVPRFGEAVVGVPVTVSVLRMVREMMGLLDGQSVDRISYQMHGKLSGPSFGSVRFESRGEFTLPTGAPPAAEGRQE
jgi:LEA14-like dessication related protein